MLHKGPKQGAVTRGRNKDVSPPIRGPIQKPHEGPISGPQFWPHLEPTIRPLCTHLEPPYRPCLSPGNFFFGAKLKTKTAKIEKKFSCKFHSENDIMVIGIRS